MARFDIDISDMRNLGSDTYSRLAVLLNNIKCNRKIIVTIPSSLRAKKLEKKSNDILHVYLASYPSHIPRPPISQKLITINGVLLETRMYQVNIKPNNNYKYGMFVLKSEEKIIAFIAGDSVFILFDPIQTGVRQVQNISRQSSIQISSIQKIIEVLNYIIEQAVNVIDNNSRATSLKDIDKNINEIAQKFLLIEKERLRTKTAHIGAELVGEYNNIIQKEQELVKYQHDLENINQKIKDNSLLTMLKNIKRHPKVSKVYADSGILYVETKQLMMHKLPIGRYLISLSMDDKYVTIHNLNIKGYRYDHVHVRKGVPCFGNYRGIIKLIVNSNWDIAIDLIIKFLQHMNPKAGGPYVSLSEWYKHAFGSKRYYRHLTTILKTVRYFSTKVEQPEVRIPQKSMVGIVERR